MGFPPNPPRDYQSCRAAPSCTIIPKGTKVQLTAKAIKHLIEILVTSLAGHTGLGVYESYLPGVPFDCATGLRRPTGA